jgi:hypothetical protein
MLEDKEARLNKKLDVDDILVRSEMATYGNGCVILKRSRRCVPTWIGWPDRTRGHLSWSMQSGFRDISAQIASSRKKQSNLERSRVLHMDMHAIEIPGTRPDSKMKTT